VVVSRSVRRLNTDLPRTTGNLATREQRDSVGGHWQLGAKLNGRGRTQARWRGRRWALQPPMATPVIARQVAAGRRWRPGQQWLALRPQAAMKHRACPGDVNRSVRRSRSRVGWCACSSRLLCPVCHQRSTPGGTSHIAVPSLVGVSVIATHGTGVRACDSRRGNSAVASSRRHCAGVSRTSLF